MSPKKRATLNCVELPFTVTTSTLRKFYFWPLQSRTLVPKHLAFWCGLEDQEHCQKKKTEAAAARSIKSHASTHKWFDQILQPEPGAAVETHVLRKQLDWWIISRPTAEQHKITSIVPDPETSSLTPPPSPEKRSRGHALVAANLDWRRRIRESSS